VTGGQGGTSLPEVLAAIAIVGLGAVAGGASLAPAARARAVEGAARALAGRFRLLSLAARSDGRDRALLFPPVADGDEPLRVARDGDGDGVTRRDVQAGVDPVEDGPYTPGREFPGVRVGRPPWEGVPDLPPSRRVLGPGDPAVRFGRARMVTFDPEGHASPGSIFLTDGRDALCAVVVTGATARVRAWCFDRERWAWQLR